MGNMVSPSRAVSLCTRSLGSLLSQPQPWAHRVGVGPAARRPALQRGPPRTQEASFLGRGGRIAGSCPPRALPPPQTPSDSACFTSDLQDRLGSARWAVSRVGVIVGCSWAVGSAGTLKPDGYRARPREGGRRQVTPPALRRTRPPQAWEPAARVSLGHTHGRTPLAPGASIPVRLVPAASLPRERTPPGRWLAAG